MCISQRSSAASPLYGNYVKHVERRDDVVHLPPRCVSYIPRSLILSIIKRSRRPRLNGSQHLCVCVCYIE